MKTKQIALKLNRDKILQKKVPLQRKMVKGKSSLIGGYNISIENGLMHID